MFMPPADLRDRSNMPEPRPVIIPAVKAFSKRSSIEIAGNGMRRAWVYISIPAILYKKKRLPTNIQPKLNIGMF